MPTVGSLFSGVGGFDMGFEAAGFTVAWQVENDRDAVSVLEHHWPTVPRYGDIATVDGADLCPVDAVIGGFPCQDLSVAGRRGGLAGARSGLYWDAVRIVRQMREATGGRFPAFVVLENVPGLLSSGAGTNRGRDFAAVLGGLRELGAAVGYRILDARFFGVPQRRRRVFIVAGFAGLRPGAERTASVLSLTPSSSRHPAASGETRQGAAGDAESGPRVTGWAENYEAIREQDVTPSITQAGLHPRQNAGGFMVAARDVADGAGGAGEPDAPVASWKRRGGYGYSETSGLAPTLEAEGGTHTGGPMAVPLVAAEGGNHTSGPLDVATACNAHGGPHGRLDFESETFVVATPLTAGNEHGCSSIGVATFDERNVTSRANRTRVEYGAPANTLHAEGLSVITPMAVRRLTPTECERLQGWPDSHTAYRADGSEISDGPRYRMIGNGVVAPVAQWLAARMRAVLES